MAAGAPAEAALGARTLAKAEAGKELSARHIQQRIPRWKQYAERLLSTASGAPAADMRMLTTALQIQKKRSQLPVVLASCPVMGYEIGH